MSSTTLYRLGGISVLIGSLLLIIGDIPGFFAGNDQASTIFIISSLVRLIGAMLIALGLSGMYARFAERTVCKRQEDSEPRAVAKLSHVLLGIQLVTPHVHIQSHRRIEGQSGNG